MAKRRITKQYSKRVVTAMIAAWFAGIAFGMAVIVWQMIRAPDAVSLDSLLTYIGAPMGCGIAGYLAKSAFENREKIKAKYIPEYDEMMEEENHEENRLGTEIDEP